MIQGILGLSNLRLNQKVLWEKVTNLRKFLFQITWTENDTEFPLEVDNATGELSAKFDMTNTVNTSFLFNLTAKDKVILIFVKFIC